MLLLRGTPGCTASRAANPDTHLKNTTNHSTAWSSEIQSFTCPCCCQLFSYLFYKQKRNVSDFLSQVEEHHETYCLVRRLRDGADKMIKAYTASPGSKEAKESLAEANKSYKEYTEVRMRSSRQQDVLSALMML